MACWWGRAGPHSHVPLGAARLPCWRTADCRWAAVHGAQPQPSHGPSQSSHGPATAQAWSSREHADDCMAHNTRHGPDDPCHQPEWLRRHHQMFRYDEEGTNPHLRARRKPRPGGPAVHPVTAAQRREQARRTGTSLCIPISYKSARIISCVFFRFTPCSRSETPRPTSVLRTRK